METAYTLHLSTMFSALKAVRELFNTPEAQHPPLTPNSSSNEWSRKVPLVLILLCTSCVRRRLLSTRSSLQLNNGQPITACPVLSEHHAAVRADFTNSRGHLRKPTDMQKPPPASEEFLLRCYSAPAPQCASSLVEIASSSDHQAHASLEKKTPFP